VLVTEPNAELVGPCEFPGREAIIFEPANPGGFAFLAIEEPAFRGFQLYTIRIVTLCRHVRVKAFRAKLRSQDATCADQVAVLCVDLIAALVKIRRRFLGVKRVQAEVIEFLRIEGYGCVGGVSRTDGEVELRVGIEAFEFGIPLKRRKTVYRRFHKSIFERLRHGDFVAQEWPGERCPRS
jgi:hypothetical protein